jgi:predicted DNA-binding protein
VPGEPELREASLRSRLAPVMVYDTYIMMRRTQIYLDDRQRRKLDHVAKRTRRTVSELIREAIDARYAATPKEDFLDALRAGTFGVWKDRRDLGRTDRYVRRVRRGHRMDRLAR